MFRACLITACSKMAWGVIGGAGHAHDLPSHFCKPGNLRLILNRQVTKPAGDTISQNRLYTCPVKKSTWYSHWLQTTSVYGGSVSVGVSLHNRMLHACSSSYPYQFALLGTYMRRPDWCHCYEHWSWCGLQWTWGPQWPPTFSLCLSSGNSGHTTQHTCPLQTCG